jgi:hypothetical protein
VLSAAGLQAGEPVGLTNLPDVVYTHDTQARGPWSVHVLRIDRPSQDLELHSTLGRGTALGVGTLTDQLKTLPAELGWPVAAINGDYAKAGLQYQAHPLGLQIMRGELVSAPCKDPCFWVDKNGQPQAACVVPQFKLTWPNQQVTVLGLNDERTNGGAMLYTRALGASTRTVRGRELIVEQADPGGERPLGAGEQVTARVREVREAGDSLLAPGTWVISLSPSLLPRVPKVAPGDALRISTDFMPALSGVQTAIGGGPILLRAGKAASFTKGSASWLEVHPRTGVGWNDRFLFLVVVDGRQKNLSVGMSLPELAAYMKKLGCQEAMNLDGGGSSTFWFEGRVLNRPCEGRERPMVNALVLVRKPGSPDRKALSTEAGPKRARPGALSQ